MDETIESGYQKAQVALTYAKYMESEKLVAYDEAFDQKIKRTSDLKELLKKEEELRKLKEKQDEIQKEINKIKTKDL